MTTGAWTLSHEFVQSIPRELEPGTLYISVGYATAMHLCCCGCGREVVTPISPTGWSLVFDGETVSLDPSIGNWSFPCQSHYWIQSNQVVWATHWSRERIEASREYDRAARNRYYEQRDAGHTPTRLQGAGRRREWLERLRRWLPYW